jgi:pyruvate-formate lyase-activating enzyme
MCGEVDFEFTEPVETIIENREEGYFDIGAFHSPKSRSKRVLSVMASRGCPEKCSFCTTPEMWGALVRWREVIPVKLTKRCKKTVEFAMDSGADSFSFAILSPLPGTQIYRKVMKENLWWPGRTLDDMMYRTSLVQVDGFNTPEEFEEFVTDANITANRTLQERDPERFKLKYGADTSERVFG